MGISYRRKGVVLQKEEKPKSISCREYANETLRQYLASLGHTDVRIMFTQGSAPQFQIQTLQPDATWRIKTDDWSIQQIRGPLVLAK